MGSKLVNKKRKILRAIYGTLSFSTVLFVFQACYGIEEDFGNDIRVIGTVTSSGDGKPIKGIKVSAGDEYQYDVTNSEGTFDFYTYGESELTITFTDTDSTKNGNFVAKDTVVIIDSRTTIELNISLNAQ
jgi:hypothetical protein